jgi:anthranilate/para-aminobenzoate synthase component I
LSAFERRLELDSDPFELVRALADRPGVFLAFAEEGRVAYLGCDPLAQSSKLDPEPDLGLSPGRAAGAAPRWVGCLPYEACRELERSVTPEQRPPPHLSAPLWLRYGAVARVDGAVRELGARLLCAKPAGAVGLQLSAPLEPEAAHFARIERALAEIRSGNVYEVNLARRLELLVEGTPWDLLAALGRAGLPPHAFALRWDGLDVCAVSPELCLRLEPDRRLVTRPIKGTRPRDDDPLTDARLARELDQDPKECAELTMILDVERNDLGRVATVGSVRLAGPPTVVSLPSVHHRLATLEAELRAGVSRAELLAAFLPSGSVTGAPKRRAMQLIAELEPHRRGLYTGAVGFVRHDGGLELSMAIRTLTSRGGHGHYFTGGGIVADSIPALEVQETLWKAERLFWLMGQSAKRQAAGEVEAKNFPD